jgi:hypothetical protein
VAGFGAVALVMTQYSTALSGGPAGPPVIPRARPIDTAPGPAAPNTPTPGAPAAPAAPDAANGGRAPVQPKAQAGLSQVDARSIYVNDGGTDAPLRADLAAAIKERGLTVVANPAAARLEITGTVQVSVRPSPFGQTSALTADYVATLETRDRVTGERKTVQFDGHALDFGETVVRAAALRRAAEQMAEAAQSALQ